jgi:glycosyltransferase involved in cell wall biosynthesis
MKILSINVGAPSDDYSAWIRKIKIAKIMFNSEHEVDFLIYTHKGECNKEILKEFEFDYEIEKVSFLNFYPKYINRLLNGNYDIVFCNGSFTHAALFFTKFSHSKFILDRHGDIVTEFLLLENGFRYDIRFILWYLRCKFIDFLNMHFVNKITCVSHKMIEYCYKNGLKKGNGVYVTNGIDLDFFKTPPQDSIQEIKDKLKINDKLIFTYVGALDKWQGVDEFIEAAKALKNHSDIAFLIVGGEKEVKDGNIFYIPKVPQEKVLIYYAVSDILVLPRPSHPATEVAAPTKFPEYLAMGKPILITDVGDAAEFVKEFNCGIVVEKNDPSSLLDGILEFKNKKAEELEKMGSKSKLLAQKEFSIEKMSKDLLNALIH